MRRQRQDEDLWKYKAKVCGEILYIWGQEQEHKMGLTRYSAEVEVFSDDLLKLAVHWAGCEALTQVQPEILAQCGAWGKGKDTTEEEAERERET